MDERFLPASPQEILIPPLPASGYYVPNFITESEEAYLLQKVYPLALASHDNALIAADFARSTLLPYQRGKTSHTAAFKPTRRPSRLPTHSSPASYQPGFQSP